MFEAEKTQPAGTRREAEPSPALPTPGSNIDPVKPAAPAASVTPEQAELSASPLAADTPHASPEDASLAGIALVATPLPSPSAAPVPDSGFPKLTAALGLASALLLCLVVLLLRAVIRGKRKVPRHGVEKTPNQKPNGLEVGNAHHVGRRENQEDSFAISDLKDSKLCRTCGILAVVADGMGGLADGEAVSASVTSSVMREFPVLSPSLTPPQKLLYLVEQANTAGNAVTGGIKNHGGSTMIVALISDSCLWFASVGDSRIYLVRGGGVIPLTRAHIYETDLDHKAACGGISFDTASMDSQRRALTSYIGMGELEHVDCSQQAVPLLPGDWVVLMTDGVFNELTGDEIARALHGSAPEAAEQIERMVLAKEDVHQDNLTAVVLRVF